MSAPLWSAPTRLTAKDIGALLDIAEDISVWRLTEARWEEIGRVLDTIALAAQSGDREAFLISVSDLELLGPIRATRIGSTPTVPTPAPVRDRINVLVHTLGGPTNRSGAHDDQTARH
jgi:hypothetical protein